MKYIYLMKKIAEQDNITNEDIDNLRKQFKDNKIDISDKEYKESMEKYLNNKSKDLYC